MGLELESAGAGDRAAMLDCDCLSLIPFGDRYQVDGANRPHAGGDLDPGANSAALGPVEDDRAGVSHPKMVRAEIGKLGPHPMGRRRDRDDEPM